MIILMVYPRPDLGHLDRALARLQSDMKALDLARSVMSNRQALCRPKNRRFFGFVIFSLVNCCFINGLRERTNARKQFPILFRLVNDGF